MVKYLLDTCTIISILRNDSAALEWVMKAGIDRCFISELTMAELYVGPLRRMRTNGGVSDSECRKAESELRLIQSIGAFFGILPLAGCARAYAAEHERLRAAGLLIEDMDLLIGSFAVSNGFTLVTSNLKHFSRIEGLKLADWR